ELLIERAIKSVINQTYNNWELIVVDDGSIDNTFLIVKKYIQNHKNIRYLFHSNKKLPLSLNTGVSASCGKFITFLGSDDEYKPEHLEKRVNIVENNNNIDFVHGGVEIIGDPYVKDKNDLSKLIHLNDCTIGGTFFIKKDLLIKLNGFNNLIYSEDSELFERASNITKILKVDFPTYIYYRDTTDSICNTI
ncbi:MAG TPA: glycosyltransferase, partial [Melioribacteraceae bacterium]|nr:glycosyltransferase [Melioribacteraceae bacterium]